MVAGWLSGARSDVGPDRTWGQIGRGARSEARSDMRQDDDTDYAMLATGQPRQKRCCRGKPEFVRMPLAPVRCQFDAYMDHTSVTTVRAIAKKRGGGAMGTGWGIPQLACPAASTTTGPKNRG